MSIAHRAPPRRTMPPAQARREELDSFSDRAAPPAHIVVLAVDDVSLEAELLEALRPMGFVVMGLEDIDGATVVLVDVGAGIAERMGEVRRLTRADAAVIAVVGSEADAPAAFAAGAFSCVQRPISGSHLGEILSAATETRAADEAASARLSAVLESEEHLASIGRISAGLAHELASPLGVAAMNLDVVRGEIARLARENHLAETVTVAALQDVEASFSRIHLLLTSLGPFLRVASIELDRVPVADVIAGVIHRSAQALRGIEVESCIEPLAALADASMLEQIILHLTTNAAQAARSLPAARIRYHVYQSADRVIVSVRDNGPGIDAESRDKIFEPFYTTHRPQGARGLGLAICREFARRMGATLSVWSERGRGACFRLSLAS